MYASVLCLILALSAAAPLDDLVTEFPQIPGGKPDFSWYSGYVDVPNTSKFMHYVFFESQNNPATDPLVLWLTGGPGCSSMSGFLLENGPYIFPRGEEELIINPYSWNKNASIIYLDSPAGVGFSYYLDQEEANTNDYITAHDNLASLISWFQKFPEFAFHDFYITGESYGGIYIPTLAYNIQLYNQATSSARINLKGIAVGNGCTDWTFDTTPALLTMGFTHALYGYEMYNNMTKYDCIQENIPDECTDTMNNFETLIKNVDIYDIYAKCINPDWKDHVKFLRSGFTNDKLGAPPCTSASGIDNYLSNSTIQEAYHISPDAFEWAMCTGSPRVNYTIDYVNGSLYTYRPLINSGIKIMIYSGDVDGAVPTIGTRQWIKKLNIPVLEEYQPWTIEEGQVSGYKEQYQGLLFVTVKGAGHMVPEFKPPEASHMINNWLHDIPL